MPCPCSRRVRHWVWPGSIRCICVVRITTHPRVRPRARNKLWKQALDEHLEKSERWMLFQVGLPQARKGRGVAPTPNQTPTTGTAEESTSSMQLGAAGADKRTQPGGSVTSSQVGTPNPKPNKPPILVLCFCLAKSSTLQIQRHAPMDFLKNALDMLPRKLRTRASGVSGRSSEQAVLSLGTTKTAVSLLCAACSLQTGSGVSELPYYGLSPPVYPSRKILPSFLSPRHVPWTRPAH